MEKILRRLWLGLLLGVPALALAQTEISLSPNWQQAGAKDVSARELGQLLSKACKAQIRLKPTETPTFLRDIKFLMPSSKAGQTFGKTPGMRRASACPAFPQFSFFTYSLDVGLGDFSRLLLLTDTANQLVGMELIEDNPKDNVEYWSDEQKVTWSTYDFAQQLLKGNKTWLVRAMVQRANEVNGDKIKPPVWKDQDRDNQVQGDGWLIQIDTELLRPELSTNGGYRTNRSTYRYQIQRRVRLYLPQTIGDIILSRVDYQLR